MLGTYSKILVVDDSAVARKIIRRLFQGLGYHHVREATDGSDALRKLADLSFDLILSDCDMAPMDGATLLMKVRQIPAFRRIPFILTTATAGRKYQDLARDNGMTFFLAKPIFARELEERIRQIASAGSLLEQYRSAAAPVAY